MKVINFIDLHKINGGCLSASPSHMCVYSLIQYQNLRFDMLNHAYQGNTAENSNAFNEDKKYFEMYREWSDQNCPAELVSKYIGQ